MADLPFTDIRESGNTVFVSGKIHLDESGQLLKGSIAEKTIKTLDNIEASLKKVGLDLGHIVFAQIYVTDMGQYPEINEAYIKRLSKPYPARALVEVSKLPLGADIEIVATASRK